jgi:Xaa-Pro dipeptidase
MIKLPAVALALVLGAATGNAQPADPYADPTPSKSPAPKQGAQGPQGQQAKAGSTPEDPYAAKGSAATTPANAGSGAGSAVAAPKPIAGSGTPGVVSRVGLADVNAVQGLLAVQHLDGWLLIDRDGENPIAERLVAPEGHPSRPWFYMIPAKGDPVALVHAAEVRSFDHLAGKKLTYQGYRDLDKQLRALLKSVKSIAVEYSPKAAVPAVSKIDAGTLELLRATGANVRSSDTLVQFTKVIWGDPGRTAHYVAVHHLVELRKEALAFVAKRLDTGSAVSEYEVQQLIVRGMQVRGLVGPPPVVAAGVNTADPYYVPTAAKTAQIRKGDLIVISLAAKLDRPEGVFAAQTWCAVADATVPDNIQKAFETVALARDQALALISDRVRRNKPLTGAEVDDATRALIKKAGYADNIQHRTGHSIDNDFQGGGADLDDFEVKDTRALTPGTGFTVGPGLYFPNQFGVRTEVSVYLAGSGAEVTTPAQQTVETLLK